MCGYPDVLVACDVQGIVLHPKVQSDFFCKASNMCHMRHFLRLLIDLRLLIVSMPMYKTLIHVVTILYKEPELIDIVDDYAEASAHTVLLCIFRSFNVYYLRQGSYSAAINLLLLGTRCWE